MNFRRGQTCPSRPLHHPVKINPSVAKQPPGRAQCRHRVQIKPGRHHLLPIERGLCHQLPGLVGDKAGAIERHLPPPRRHFAPDAVAGDHGQDVGPGMAAHHRLPMRLAVIVGHRRLGPDGGGIKQHLGAQQRHGAGGLGKPLIPADAQTHPAHRGVPDPEPGVAGREIVLFLIARRLRDMAFAIGPKHAPIGVDHGAGLEKHWTGAFEKAAGQHDAEFPRQIRKARDQRMAGGRPCQVEILRPLLDAEIGRGEQFLHQHDPRPQPSRLPHQRLGPVGVVIQIPAAGELGGGQGDGAHGG